jgi:hypothetical protein
MFPLGLAAFINPHWQCLGVPGDDQHSLKTTTGPLSNAELAGRWGDEKKFVLE